MFSDRGEYVSYNESCYASANCVGEISYVMTTDIPACNVSGSALDNPYFTFGAEGSSCFVSQESRSPTPMPSTPNSGDVASTDDSPQGLSGGAVAGVTIAVMVGAGVAIFALYWFGFRKMGSQPEKSTVHNDGLITKLSPMHNDL